MLRETRQVNRERKLVKEEMRPEKSLLEALTTAREAVWITLFVFCRLEGGMIYSIWDERMCLEKKHCDEPGVHGRRELDD